MRWTKMNLSQKLLTQRFVQCDFSKDFFSFLFRETMLHQQLNLLLYAADKQTWCMHTVWIHFKKFVAGWLMLWTVNPTAKGCERWRTIFSVILSQNLYRVTDSLYVFVSPSCAQNAHTPLHMLKIPCQHFYHRWPNGVWHGNR